MNYIHPIHFTLAEARLILPEVIRMLQRLRDLKHQLDAKNYDIRLHKHFGGMITNGVKAYPDEMQELMLVFRQLTSRGILLRDIERGLIDFPCIRGGGDEVHLCYILDEQDILYWHPVDEGFSGRRPIDTL